MKEITETIVRPHWEVLISVALTSILNWRAFGDLREEQNFGNPGMCSISYFLIKRRSANHSWRPSSKAARKLPKKCELCELNENLAESIILRGGAENERASENMGGEGYNIMFYPFYGITGNTTGMLTPLIDKHSSPCRSLMRSWVLGKSEVKS